MCVVTEGDPPFTIAWSFHGNNNLTSNSDLQIRTSNIGNRTSLLMIPQVNYKHMGNYTCKVTNNAGRSYGCIKSQWYINSTFCGRAQRVEVLYSLACISCGKPI